MATVSKNFTENQSSSYKSTWTVSITGTNQTVSANFTPTMPTVTAKYVYSGKSQGQVNIRFTYGINGLGAGSVDYDKQSSSLSLVSMTSGTTYAIPKTSGSMSSITLSNIFNANNKTTRTVNLTATMDNYYTYLASDASSGKFNAFVSSGAVSFGTVATITLDVPPTATVSAISYDTNYVYAGLTTASVSISDATAYYGGDISSVVLTIGNQTASISGNGTLYIPLDTVGTFTPTVTVTDSRGQEKVYTLADITVNGYVAPSANISVERTNTSGVANDEGICAVITADISYTSVIADLVVPTVVVKDLDGITQTSSTTWYTTRTSSGVSNAISDWSAITSADMPVYGLVDNTGHNLFNTQYSYTIVVTPNDDIGSGTSITRTLGSAFYTVDFLAGGHGIAFGQPSSQTGFYCNMDSSFMQDIYIDLPNYATSGVDKDIYDALVALGWDTDVIV